MRNNYLKYIDRYNLWNRKSLPFRSTCLNLKVYWGSLCSIFCFMCNVLLIIVCRFVLLVAALSVLLSFWQLYCLSFLDWWLLIAMLASSSSRPMHCLFYRHWQLLITMLVSSSSRPMHCLPYLDWQLDYPLVNSNISCDAEDVSYKSIEKGTLIVEFTIIYKYQGISNWRLNDCLWRHVYFIYI